MPRAVSVPLSGREYQVLIGPGLLSDLGRLTAGLVPLGRAFLAADANLPPATTDAAAASLRAAGFAITTTTLRATEPDKSLDTLTRLLVEIAATRHERSDPVIALGGGIVGDVGGFAAAIYRRGVPVIQCPTTLLAMVDASVGGKTGVNLRTGPGNLGLRKNLVGAFHQPALVLADVATLASLPDRHYRCGLAECIKHAVIASADDGGELLAWTEAALPAVLARDPGAVSELVERNVRVKAGIVARDEREDPALGRRAALNLGHTFAHAIETIPHLSPTGDPADAPLLHGEAVALGLVAAARCAETLGLCPAALGDRLTDGLRKIGLPTSVRGLPPAAEVIAAMAHDKKVASGRLRLILPIGAGVRIVDNPPEASVRAGLAAISM